jgi:RNA polymerase sigma-70 factor (ECF subfamily)
MSNVGVGTMGTLLSAPDARTSVERDLSAVADEDLLRACARGEREALRELTYRYQTPLYRFLYRLMGSHEDAEEAVLDVFVKAWQHAGRFKYQAKVATWLYRIAINAARDAHSRKKARPQAPWPDQSQLERLGVGSAEEDALRSLHREEASEALQRALAKLNPNDRALLVMYYLDDREYDEIKAITGLSYTVLKTRLARARRRLRQLLESESGGART